MLDINIIIAIFLIYALFAGLVSGINELIIEGMAMRGRVLFEGIAMMLGELPNKTYKPGIFKSFFIKNANLTEDLYKHPLINSLSPAGSSRPSYISPSTFSAALVQILSNDGSLTALQQKLDNRSTPLGQLLGPMLDEARGDIEKFKAKIEAHFNAVTDRVSGWYKRRAQFVMFFIGFVLAILFNVDSIYIVQQLQNNPTQVEKLVTLADQLVTGREEVKKPALPVDIEETPSAASKDYSERIDNLAKEIDMFRNMGQPIGWSFPQSGENPDLGAMMTYIGKQLFDPVDPMKWLGLFLTALAGALGAPFWFDAISKLFAIRGSGKRPDESTATPAASPATVQVVVPSTASPSSPQEVPLNDFEASRLNGDDIEGLQRALGFSPEKINGKFSEELRNSLREWQRISGRAITGQFDEPTVLSLLYSGSKGE